MSINHICMHGSTRFGVRLYSDQWDLRILAPTVLPVGTVPVAAVVVCTFLRVCLCGWWEGRVKQCIVRSEGVRVKVWECVCVVRGCILGVVKFYPASLTAYHNGATAHLLNCKSSKVFGSYYKRASPIPPTHPSPTTHPVTPYGTAAGSQCLLGPRHS